MIHIICRLKDMDMDFFMSEILAYNCDKLLQGLPIDRYFLKLIKNNSAF